MYIISSRLRFINSDESNRNSSGVIVNKIKKVDIKSGVIADTETHISTLLDEVKNKKILILVHGYNNVWDDIREAYSILETNFNNTLTNTKQKYDEILGFIWPGGDSIFDYSSAKNRAKDHFEPLANLISSLRSVSSVIDMMTHSMGSYLTLHALTFYVATPNTFLLRNLFLTASAVDDELIQYGERLYPATQLCENVYIFHSRNDKTLRLGYPLMDGGNKALGLDGVENVASIIEHSKNVVTINCIKKIWNHGDYKHSPDVYKYLYNAIVTGHSAQFETL